MAIVSAVAGGALSWLTKPRLPKRFVVELVISGPLREAPGGVSLGLLEVERLSLAEVARGLRAVAADPRVRGVLLRISSVQTGWAAAREIRRALHTVRQSGIPVIALIEAGGDKEYALASVADSVFLLPAGYLLLDGLAAEVGFVKGVMEKVGLEAQIERVGAYKSAPETYTRTGMSDEFRLSIDALLDDMFEAYVVDAAEGRRMPRDQFRARVDAGPFSADDALTGALVDGLRYRAQVLEGLDVDEREVVSLERFLAAAGNHHGTRVAYVVVEGGITPGRSSDLPFAEPTAGSESLAEALREAREDDGLKGVLLRVNSPGGSATASDVIWDEVRRTAEVKPVVVSMGDVAASGGYYVAMPANMILAEATTVTGSIGVYAGKLVAEGLYDKIGYHVEVLKRGTHADLFSETRPFTEDERETLQKMLLSFYHSAFIAKAAEGREMASDRIDSLGRGRVWSGLRAQANGLVDTLGGIWDAQRELARLIELPPGGEVVLVPVPKPRSLLSRAAELLLLSERDGPVISRLTASYGITPEPGISMRMPCSLDIE
jgi:protease-4